MLSPLLHDRMHRMAERRLRPFSKWYKPRFLVVGQIRQDRWTAVVTYRHEETIRLISVRHARDGEKKQYVGAREGRYEAGHDHG